MALPPIEKLREAAEQGGIDVSDLGSKKTEIITRLQENGIEIPGVEAEPTTILDDALDVAEQPANTEHADVIEFPKFDFDTPADHIVEETKEPKAQKESNDDSKKEDEFEYKYPEDPTKVALLPVGAYAVKWEDTIGWDDFVTQIGMVVVGLTKRVLGYDEMVSIAKAVAPLLYNGTRFMGLSDKPSFLTDAVMAALTVVGKVQSAPKLPENLEDLPDVVTSE